MARGRGVGGVFFKANDPERLIEWYRETLDIAVDGPSPHIAWFVDPDENRVELWEPAASPARS